MTSTCPDCDAVTSGGCWRHANRRDTGEQTASVTGGTWRGILHPMDEERVRLREQNNRLAQELEILGRKLRSETEAHAKTRKLRIDDLIPVLEGDGWECPENVRRIREENEWLGREREKVWNALGFEKPQDCIGFFTVDTSALVQAIEKLKAELAELKRPKTAWDFIGPAVERERRARCKQCETRNCDRCDWALPCSCPMALDGTLTLQRDCQRHGPGVRWEEADK